MCALSEESCVRASMYMFLYVWLCKQLTTNIPFSSFLLVVNALPPPKLASNTMGSNGSRRRAPDL